MDTMTRDLVIRLRWVNNMTRSLRELQKQIKDLDLLQEAMLSKEQKREIKRTKEAAKLARKKDRENVRSIEAAARRDAKVAQEHRRAVNERFALELLFGVVANHQEREEYQRKQKDLEEKKRRRAAAMGLIHGFANAATRTAMWGGTIGLDAGTGLVKDFIEAARKADNARMSIAALIQSTDQIVKGPFEGVQDSFALTTDLIQQMHQAAIDTPASFNDIKSSFRDIVVPMRMAGSSYREMIGLASDMSIADKVHGFEPGVVSRDVQQLLRGDIGEISTPMLRENRMQIQKLYKSNKHKEMRDLIASSIAIDPEMKRLFEESPEGRISQMQDHWEMFKAEAGTPILGWINEQLGEALDYIKNNKDEVKNWAKELGEGVRDALIWIKDTLKWMWDNRENIIGWAKWLAGAAGLAVAVTAVNNIYTGLQNLIKIAPALGGALGKALGPLGWAAAVLGMPIEGDTTIADAFGFLGGVAVDAVFNDGDKTKAWFWGDGGKGWENNAKNKEQNKLYESIKREAETLLNYRPGIGEGLDLLDTSYVAQPGDVDYIAAEIPHPVDIGMDLKPADYQKWATKQLEYIRNNRELVRDLWSTDAGGLPEVIVGAWDKMSLKDIGVTPNTNIDARGAKITIHQRVETNNPAALARASLSAGFEAVAKRPIRASQRPGSVRLANGDKN